MKKLIVLSVVMALTLLVWSLFTPSHAQEAAKEEKPTFYRLVPGTYVNGWPRFTIHYPKDWVERLPIASVEVFRATVPGTTQGAGFEVAVYPWPLPLDEFSDRILLPYFRVAATDVTVVSDKPSHLRDGTPAREVEFQMVMNAEPFNSFTLGTKKGDLLVMTTIFLASGKLGEDLKAIAYSLEFQPGKDELVKVPPDIQEFLEKFCSDFVSHDLAQLMTHYSDRYLHSGVRKGEMERHWRQSISSITSHKVSITDFKPAGDRAYLAGFSIINGLKWPLISITIIKENGEWKWYGNQRNVSP